MARQIEKGAHSLSWGTKLKPEDVFPRLKVAKALGCQAFEVYLGGDFSEDLASELQHVAHGTGITLVGCGVILEGQGDPLSTNEEVREKAVGTIKEYITLVQKMGSDLLVGPLANVLARSDPHFPTDAELDAGVRTFREVASFAELSKVKVAIEFLQDGEMVWPSNTKHLLDFIEQVEQKDGVPREGLGVLFDVFHANRMEENMYRALQMVLDAGRLLYMHAAGPARTPPEKGQHISWKRIATILKKAKWAGTVTTESFGKECDLPPQTTGYGTRLPAVDVIAAGVETFRWAGL